MKKEYPYKARLVAFAKAIQPLEEQKNVAFASLKNLSNVFSGQEIQAKIDANPDLFFWASNLALLDQANLNDDALRKSDALKVFDKFTLKLVDIEHNREDIIGCIYDAGFSMFGSNEVITAEQAAASTGLVQLVIGGYLWRTVADEVCDMIVTASLESSPSYGDISTSFELMFDNYEIGVGTSRDINQARIILKRGDPEFLNYDKLLKAKGGNGKTEEGEIVYRILSGDILPLGAGIVARPASGLKGVLPVTKHTAVEMKVEKATLDNIADPTDEKSLEKYVEAIISLRETVDEAIHSSDPINKDLDIKTTVISVTQDTTTLLPMKIKSIDELASNWAEVKKLETVASVVADLKEVAEASTRKMIEDAIAEKSVEFAKQIKAKEELNKTVEENKVAAEAKAKELEDEVTTLKNELKTLKASHAAKAAEDKFDSRMRAINEEFDLDEEDNSFIVEEVKSIDSDETFAKYMAKQKKLMCAKKKKVKKDDDSKKDDTKDGVDPDEPDADDAKSKAKASVNVKEVVASILEKDGQEIPNTVPPTESLKERVRKVMGESVIVGKTKVKDYQRKE